MSKAFRKKNMLRPQLTLWPGERPFSWTRRAGNITPGGCGWLYIQNSPSAIFPFKKIDDHILSTNLTINALEASVASKSLELLHI